MQNENSRVASPEHVLIHLKLVTREKSPKTWLLISIIMNFFFQILNSLMRLFLARLYIYTGRAIALPRRLRWRGQNVKVFTLKFSKVMGKALSGELFYTRTGLVDKIKDIQLNNQNHMTCLWCNI